MAKSPEVVEKFLRELSVKLDPLQDVEMKVLLDLKAKEKAALGEPFGLRCLMVFDLIVFCVCRWQDQHLGSADCCLFQSLFTL